MRLTILTFLLSVFLAVPGTALAKQKVRLLYVEWDCATATTYLAKTILEDMGYEVEALPVSVPIMWQSLAIGDADGMLAAWLPTTHGQYKKKLAGKVVPLGPLMTGGRAGWVVPDYMPITSMADLARKDVADKIDNKIVGIEEGASIHDQTEDAFKAYGIKDVEILPTSGAIMVSELKNAIRQKKWIVVIGWTPHWKFGTWPLRFLDDPKKTLAGEEEIWAFARKGLQEDMPEVYNFLDKFSYTDASQLGTLMAWNQEPGMTPEKAAKRFIEKFPDQVASWKK